MGYGVFFIMDEKKRIINRSIDAVIETPFSFSITNKLDDVDVPDEIIIKPATPYTFFKINKLINQLPKFGKIEPLADKRLYSDEHVKIVEKNKDLVLDIICIAWWNKKGDYPPEYKEVLLHGVVSIKEWLLVFYEIVMRIGYMDFINTTALMLQAGLYNEPEIIAGQKKKKNEKNSIQS